MTVRNDVTHLKSNTYETLVSEVSMVRYCTLLIMRQPMERDECV